MSTIVKTRTRKSHDADTEILSYEYPKTNSRPMTSDSFSIADAQPVTDVYPSSNRRLAPRPLTVTRICSERPDVITKAFNVGEDGHLNTYSLTNL